jgi:hypothetical protein
MNTDCVWTRAVLRLTGDSGALTAALVTARLGIKPTAAIEGAHRIVPAESMWILSTGREAADEEAASRLAEQLARLLDVLEPRSEVLSELSDMGYRARWECSAESPDGHAVVEIGQQLMARLAALPGDLWLDIRADDAGLG